MLLQTEFDKPVEKPGEIHTGSPGGPGEQTCGCHSGNSVGFKYINLFIPENHIGSAVTPAKQCLVSNFGVGLRPLR